MADKLRPAPVSERSPVSSKLDDKLGPFKFSGEGVDVVEVSLNGIDLFERRQPWIDGSSSLSALVGQHVCFCRQGCRDQQAAQALCRPREPARLHLQPRRGLRNLFVLSTVRLPSSRAAFETG